MNIYLIVILCIILGKYFLDTVVDILNIKTAATKLPSEFAGYYDEDKYSKSQRYLKERTSFGIIEDSFFTFVTVCFIVFGGFNIIDKFARSFGQNTIITALIFAGTLILIARILQIPFSFYRTFVIEERYGFNRTTLKTFFLDIIKGFILTVLIGGVIFSLIVWFFMHIPNFAWVWCWVTVVVFELFLIFIAPVVIMPLFNKFVPLEEGELKDRISQYARSQEFTLKGIFKMDASRRSSKSNAFFTGFGKNRRIVLFDTLIERHTPDELLSVLAHEVGHYKKKHIFKMFLISVATSGIMFFILSFFINNNGLFSAFGMEHISVYASIFFFGFLYTPINMVFSVFTNILSRKHEYEADRYAVDTYRKPEAFITALKKLVVDNLSNLTPHPAKVFLYYSHPPVLERIKAIRAYV